jgi:hypothetical protein
MPFDRIGVRRIHLEGEDRFIIVELDSELRKPFMQTSSALSKSEAADALRKLDMPEAEIARLLAQDS